MSATIYEGNSNSKVPCFIPPERIPALRWSMDSVNTYTIRIHHRIAVAGKFAPGGFPVN